MGREGEKYGGWWYCENIIEEGEEVGVLDVGFGGCLVVIGKSGDL